MFDDFLREALRVPGVEISDGIGLLVGEGRAVHDPPAVLLIIGRQQLGHAALPDCHISRVAPLLLNLLIDR